MANWCRGCSGGRDPYDPRREAGRASRTQTRQRLLASADALFRVRGYAATAVPAIADGAGDSPPTLYLAWGSKEARLQARRRRAASGSAIPLDAQAWHATVHQAVRQEASVDAGATCEQERPSAYLRGLAMVFAAVAQRTADYWRINQEAAPATRSSPSPDSSSGATGACRRWPGRCCPRPCRAGRTRRPAPGARPPRVRRRQVWVAAAGEQVVAVALLPPCAPSDRLRLALHVELGLDALPDLPLATSWLLLPPVPGQPHVSRLLARALAVLDRSGASAVTPAGAEAAVAAVGFAPFGASGLLQRPGRMPAQRQLVA